MAWFFGLGLLIFAPIFIIISWHAVRTWFAADPIRIGILGFTFIDGFAVGLIPFALIYIPVYVGAGTRDFSQYLLDAPSSETLGTLDLISFGRMYLIRLVSLLIGSLQELAS